MEAGDTVYVPPPRAGGALEHIGSTLGKEFGTVEYRGTVDAYDDGANLFRVVYEDGDVEEYNEREVAALITATGYAQMNATARRRVIEELVTGPRANPAWLLGTGCSWLLRLEAVRSLAAGGAQGAWMVTALGDPRDEVREAVLASTAGTTGASRYVGAVVPRLKDPAPGVRSAALAFLSGLPGGWDPTDAHLSAVAALGGDRDAGVRAAALRLLGEAAGGDLDDEHMAVIARGLSDENRGVRDAASSAVEAVAAAGGAAVATAALEAALRDPGLEVAARTALSKALRAIPAARGGGEEPSSARGAEGGAPPKRITFIQGGRPVATYVG